MGRYLIPMESGDNSMVYIQKGITILSSAIDESTAETFTLGTGKCAAPDNATAYPAFNSDEIVWVECEPTGDYDIRLKRSSEAIDSSTGAFSFAAYISSTYVTPSDGTYKFNVLIHTSE